MNWAAEHELPNAEKASHDRVEYEHPAKDHDTRCGNCANYIKQAGEKARCRTVRSPIRAEDWCVRWKGEA